jgi:UrcA family protein
VRFASKKEHSMNTSRRIASRGIVACILAGMSGLVLAQQPTAIAVSYSDLDLGTRSGVTTMYARLEGAAKSVCTTRAGSWSRHEVSLCVDSTIRQAVARIGAPQLVILYETRTGHSIPHAARNPGAALGSTWASR